MQLFTDYIQPLTIWLHDNPHLALFITFLISLTESLAIIGSIIPGSVTMTAIGILAGSGVMRIDLTFVAATLGAVAGDTASYMLGYAFRDRLVNVWPFNRYPRWLGYGKEYFTRHGGKSVLIGRFVGPLRSIIPVIAGMMHMSHWRFLIANFISAIGWSILYILPGVLIGAASTELSPENATRLFILILLLLVGIWLLSVTLRWLFKRALRFSAFHLQRFWIWADKQKSLSKILRKFTPLQEKNHQATAALPLLISLFFFLLIVFSALLANGMLKNVNQATYLFLQSTRIYSFDVFFIILKQIVSPTTLITLFLSVCSIIVYWQDWRSLRYWLSLHVLCFLSVVWFNWLIISPRPQGLLQVMNGNSFPIPELTFATAQFSTLVLYVSSYGKTPFNKLITLVFLLALLLAGLASLYLGDNWLIDALGAYFLGLILSLSHWLFYRLNAPSTIFSAKLVCTTFILMLAATTLSSILNFKSSLHNHQPYITQYVLTEKAWWNQTKPVLPVYRTNRIGRRISLFNIQYVGSISSLEEALAANGWEKQNDSFISQILMRVSKKPHTAPELPLMSQLYLNRKPVLIMTYEPANGAPIQILRLWQSNYHLEYISQPIWIGSIHSKVSKKDKNSSQFGIKLKPQSLHYVSKNLTYFPQRTINLPPNINNPQLLNDVEPILLLIRERVH